jgi:hypothetical protein
MAPFLPRQNQDDCREYDSADDPGQEDRSSRRCSIRRLSLFLPDKALWEGEEAFPRNLHKPYRNNAWDTLRSASASDCRSGHYWPIVFQVSIGGTGILYFRALLQGLTIQSADEWRPSIFTPLRPLSNRRGPMLDGRKPTFSGALIPRSPTTTTGDAVTYLRILDVHTEGAESCERVAPLTRKLAPASDRSTGISEGSLTQSWAQATRPRSANTASAETGKARSKCALTSVRVSVASRELKPRAKPSARAGLAVGRGVEALRLERRVGRDPDKGRREAVAALEPPAIALRGEVRRQMVAEKRQSGWSTSSDW